MVTLTEVPIQSHEKVVKVEDKDAGLTGFIAVHDSTVGHAKNGLGISLGGIRMWPYPDESAALTDVARLSEGMTYKSAVADDGVGGAKSVIIADPKKLTEAQREKLMHAMGEAIEEFAKRYPNSVYVGAEDVNTKPEDMQHIRTKTEFISGLPYDEFDGNPSPFTAQGVLASMKQALGVETMAGKKVAISGVGNVGGRLAELLHAEDAELFVSDIDDKPEKLKTKLGSRVTVVDKDEIHKQDVDVFAPAALGGVINDKTIPEIKAKYVIGPANNQLLEPRHGEMLHNAGKVFIPDFVANAGGVIAVAMEVDHRKRGIPLTEKEIADVVERKIRTSTQKVLDTAQAKNIPNSDAGLVLAREILDAAKAQQQGTWVNRARGGNASQGPALP